MDKIENALLSGQLDTALSMLDNLDTASIHTVAGNARYTVLKALAYDKCYIDDGSLVTSLDSLSDWYFHHGSRKERMLYWYYFGDQLFDLARYDEAIVPLARSLDLAQERKDWFYCGLSSKEIADIFRYCYVSSEELKYAEMSYGYFLKTGSDVHILNSNLGVAVALYNTSDILASKTKFNQVIQDARNNDCPHILYQSLVSSSSCYLLPPDNMNPDIVCSRLAEALSISGDLFSKGWADYAYASYLCGKNEEAKQFFVNAYNRCLSTQDSLYVLNRVKDITAYNKHNLTERMVPIMDDLMTNMFDNSVLNILKGYYESQSELKSARWLNMLLILIMITLLAIMTILSLIVYFQSRDKRNLIAIQELSATIENLKNNVGAATAMRYSFKFFDPVFNEYCHGGDINSNSLLKSFKQMLSGFSREGGAQTEFKDMVDKANDNVISKMRGCKVFREEENFLYSMCISGLSYFAIAAILGIDNVSVAKRVARLRSKIQTKVSPEVADELLGKMPMRR